MNLRYTLFAVLLLLGSSAYPTNLNKQWLDWCGLYRCAQTGINLANHESLIMKKLADNDVNVQGIAHVDTKELTNLGKKAQACLNQEPWTTSGILDATQNAAGYIKEAMLLQAVIINNEKKRIQQGKQDVLRLGVPADANDHSNEQVSDSDIRQGRAYFVCNFPMQWMQEDSRLEDYIEVNGCTRPRQPLSKRELLNAMHDHTGNVRASMEVVEDPSFKESLNEQVYAGGYPQPDKLCKPHRGRK